MLGNRRFNFESKYCNFKQNLSPFHKILKELILMYGQNPWETSCLIRPCLKIKICEHMLVLKSHTLDINFFT